MTRDEMAWTLFHSIFLRELDDNQFRAKEVAEFCYAQTDLFLMCNLRTKFSASVSSSPDTAEQVGGTGTSPVPPSDRPPAADNSRAVFNRTAFTIKRNGYAIAGKFLNDNDNSIVVVDMPRNEGDDYIRLECRRVYEPLLGDPPPFSDPNKEYPVPDFRYVQSPKPDDIREIWNWWNEEATLYTMMDFRQFLLERGLCR